MSDTMPVDLEDLRNSSMTDDQYERFIKMEMALKRLQEDTSSQFTNLRAIETKMDKLLTTVEAGKLSWKILIGLGAAALTIAPVFYWLLNHLVLRP